MREVFTLSEVFANLSFLVEGAEVAVLWNGKEIDRMAKKSKPKPKPRPRPSGY